MILRAYYDSLNSKEKMAYAERAGTSSQYIQIHLMSAPPRKVPRPDLMRQLVDATDGACSLEEVLSHFYPCQTPASHKLPTRAGATA